MQLYQAIYGSDSVGDFSLDSRGNNMEKSNEKKRMSNLDRVKEQERTRCNN